MVNPVSIELLPLGRTILTERGTPLQDLLFAQGVEFPCGGRGRCKGCRIKVLHGSLPVTGDDRRLLSDGEIEQGWRLACRGHAEANLKIELAQWEAAILADDSVFDFKPRMGLGVALDLGTTTVVGQLLDLTTGHVLAVRTALNAQAKYGADIMSRVEFATAGGGLNELCQLIRGQVCSLIQELFGAAERNVSHLKDVVLVGNTVMHHLFCGLDLHALAHTPFESSCDGLQVFQASELGWPSPLPSPLAPLPSDGRGEPRGTWDTTVRFLPCLGGFVGSDLLAGVLATKLHQSEALGALIDLGTNGEIVVGNRERLLCASTAAGPAFEGAHISMGMRASTGAIAEVNLREGQLQCRVLGQTPPRGICGSGLVDAVAAGLQLGVIQTTGRLVGGGPMVLCPPVQLTQNDIRELQLAKGAIAAGLRILVQRWGAELTDLSQIHLAGAFGNYISRASARRIGLIDFPPEKVRPAGNTALLGAKLALVSLQETNGAYPDILRRIAHVPLNEDSHFLEVYVEEMQFPGRAG